MKARGLFVIFLGVFLILFSNCDKISFPGQKGPEPPKPAPAVSSTGTVIALVNDTPIILEDLEEEIEEYNNLVPEDQPEMKIATREQKITYLKDELVRRHLLYQEALRRGLERNTDIRRALEKTKLQLLVFQLVKEETDKVSVTSKEIEDHYNQFKEQLKEPEEMQVREIVVISESQAKDLLIRIYQGEDFASLAREYSKTDSASKGGDLGFISPGKKFKEFDGIVFSGALNTGQVSSYFKGPDGYYIVKIEGKRGGTLKSLSEKWDDIKRALTFIKQQKRIEDLVGELSRDAKIVVKEDKVK